MLKLEAPLKKKRHSKKSKESWRKHIDISDVNEFLDEQRLEERIGTVADKTNEELFVVDVKADPKLHRVTARQKRKLTGIRAPRCFAGLENTSKVSDPIVKRNRVRTKEERRHFIAKSIESANREKGILPNKEKQSLADRLKENKRQDAKKIKKEIFTKDIWEIDSEQCTNFKSPWIDTNVTEHNLYNTGTPVASVPKSAYHRRSQLEPVSIPHPGTSYNPSYKDHQDLLAEVVDNENKIIRKEEHLDRVTTAMFTKQSAAARDKDRLKELNSGLYEENDEGVATNDDGVVYKSVNPPVAVKRKDAKSRRKQREQKLIKHKLQQAKLEKKKITDIHRLKYLKEDIQSMQSSMELMRKRKEVRKIENKIAPRRLGRIPFKEEDIELNLPEDISGNLRNTKIEGSILTTAYKSMQRRNILAPSVDLGLRRRREVKRFTRNSHKEVQLPLKSKKTKKFRQ